MAEITVPEFFQRFPMERVTSSSLDDKLAEAGRDLVTVLFLWGRDCPNCDIAKREILDAAGRLRWPQVRWLHDNVYDDFDLANRFGLHGIPVFLVFKGHRLRGRITSWPGVDAFADAITRQIEGRGG